MAEARRTVATEINEGEINGEETETEIETVAETAAAGSKLIHSLW